MKCICYIILICFSLGAFCQPDHWESVVLPGDTYRYLVPSTQPERSWIQSGFDDTSWSIGNSGFGYGDDDDNTIVPNTLSLYLRHTLTIVSAGEIESLLLDMDYDDGFVAYLNGTEVARSLVSGDIPGYDQPSTGFHEAKLYTGQIPDRFEIDEELLLDGENLLSVEIHNQDINSSDLTAIPTLSVGLNTPDNRYRDVPEWFREPHYTTFESSNLPIVIITTSNGQEIPDEPKITGTMKIIKRSGGERNNLSDQHEPNYLDYDGNIRIEVRGSSSQALPKKQYALTTYDNVNEKYNVSLLGMPEENDWILNGLAFDPSLIRDYISYQLSIRIGQYASRGHYCEVMLNGEYQGLYILQEKLKADKNRIDINKIQPEDIADPEITGGYITKLDKIEGDDVVAWSMPNYGGWNSNFVHEHPKPSTIEPEQHNYIRNEFVNLANTSSTNNISLYTGFPSIIDVPSFIDFMIINELASNVDGYEFSTFFHKDRNGKLRAGPVWDFNLTFGNDLFFWGFDRSHTDIWQFDDGNNMGPMFWKDLFDDDTYRCYLTKRWIDLTKPGEALHPDEIDKLIDETVSLISESVEREEEWWGTVGDHQFHIDQIKSFVRDRTVWITNQLGTPGTCPQQEVPSLVITKINYHPFATGGIDARDLEFIEISNISSETIDLTGNYFGGTGLVYQFPTGSVILGNQSLIIASESMIFKQVHGFDPFDEFSRSLDNNGQTIKLLDGFGNVIDRVAYDDEAPWPLAAAGNGDFLEIVDPTADNNDPANWRSQQVILNVGSQSDPLITLYPNPASETLFISFPDGLVDRVNIWNLQGRLYQHLQPRQSKFSLNLESLSSGYYIVEIKSDKGRHTRKLLVNK